MNEVDEARMAARLAMQIVGGALLARGIGDSVMWEAAGGIASIAVGYYLSRKARKRLADREHAAGVVEGMAQSGALPDGIRIIRGK